MPTYLCSRPARILSPAQPMSAICADYFARAKGAAVSLGNRRDHRAHGVEEHVGNGARPIPAPQLALSGKTRPHPRYRPAASDWIKSDLLTILLPAFDDFHCGASSSPGLFHICIPAKGVAAQNAGGRRECGLIPAYSAASGEGGHEAALDDEVVDLLGVDAALQRLDEVRPAFSGLTANTLT